MIERGANVIEASARATLAVVALALQTFVIWKLYGSEIRDWWAKHVTLAWRKRWSERWEKIWLIETATDG